MFQQQTEIAGDELRAIVKPQVEQYIPEIEIKNITLKQGGIQTLFVTVNYSLVNNREEDSISLSFTNTDSSTTTSQNGY